MRLYLTALAAIFVSIGCYVECACPSITSRGSWGARAAKQKTYLRTIPPYIVVHHSDTPQCSTRTACESRVKNIQGDHMNNRGWADIGYNFLIGGDGNIYEGRGWGLQGAHVPRYNSRSIGICLIGDFQETSPPSNQLEALKNLIQCASEINKVQSNFHVIGHRQGGATTCPGDYLYNEVKSFPRWEPHPN